MAFRITDGEPVEDAIHRIAREQLERAIAESCDVDLGAGERAHQARKRSKKLRALLRLVRPQFAGYAAENRWYRDSARGLAAIRDAATSVGAFERLLGRYEERGADRAAFAAFEHYLTERRDAEQRDAGPALEQFVARMRQARERIVTWRLDAEEFGAVAGGLQKTYRRARDAMDAARANPIDASLHEWRKRTKYHAHHLRLLRPIWDEPLRARASATKALSDLLGDDHDIAVLIDALRPMTLAKAAEKSRLLILESLAREYRLELRGRAELLGARIFAEKSKHFAGRYETYWDAWRRETARRPSTLSGSG